MRVKLCEQEPVIERLSTMAALKVEGRNAEQGKLIVVAESTSSKGVRTTIDAIRQMTGVLDVQMVYHHVEPENELQQFLS